MTDLTDHAHAHAADEDRSPGSMRLGRLIVTGLIATAAAVAATSAAAAIARSLGIDFELPEGGQELPVSGVGTMTGVFSLIGIAIAVALRRWSSRPSPIFVKTAVSLTAVSLIPPCLAGANAGTVTALLLIHLTAAAVMIPALARELRR